MPIYIYIYIKHFKILISRNPSAIFDKTWYEAKNEDSSLEPIIFRLTLTILCHSQICNLGFYIE